MSTELKHIIEAGIQAQQAGELDKALHCYQSAQALAPDDAEVLSLLGLVLSLRGEYQQAEPLLREALEREPNELGFRMNMIEWLLRTAAVSEAKAELESIVATAPQFSPAWERLGDVALLQEDRRQARQCYEKACVGLAANFHVGLKLAQVHIALADYQQALAVLNTIASQQPHAAALYHTACTALAALQDWAQMEALALQWSGHHAGDTEAWRMLAMACMEQGRYRLALAHFERRLALQAENAEDLSVYGQICLQAFAYDKAAVALARAEVLEPARADTLLALSLLHTYFGRLDLAGDYCRRALRADARFIPAYSQLTQLSRGRLSQDEVNSLQSLYKDPAQTAGHRIDAGFSLAAVRAASGDYAAAFAAYTEANALNRAEAEAQNLYYDESESEARTARICTLFSRPQRLLTETQPCPVFIVGMPRSGTTLVEALLAAHSQVCAGGERPLLPQILDAVLAHASAHDNQLPELKTLQAWAAAYVDDCPVMDGAGFFTDKNPLNIEAVGLLASLFPRAAIIHIRRNPLDTCFSIFSHRFSRFWRFTHRLEDIAHYYIQYAQLVRHWQGLLGERFMTVQYEELAADFVVTAPKIIQHCGLGWEAGCLAFQEQEQAIATLSAVQIRDKVEVRIGAAANYAAYLGALRSRLQDAGIDMQSGALGD